MLSERLQELEKEGILVRTVIPATPVRVEYALSLQPVGKQLKLADAREARFAVLIGPDDRAKGEVVIKDLRTKEQVTVAASSVVKELKRRLNA
jgi:histidyl-tRNA synthetase